MSLQNYARNRVLFDLNQVRKTLPAILFLAVATASPAMSYRLKLHKVIDQGIHMLAGTYLVPQGWKTKDEITWMPLNYGTPVIGRSTITSPDGTESLLRVSALSVQYGQSTMARSGMEPPNSIGLFLASLWAKDHPGVNYRIIDKTQTPTVTHSGSYYTYNYEGSVELSYEQNGISMVTKGYARIDGYQLRSTGAAMVTEGEWTISNIVGVSAPANKLAPAMKLFAICLASFQVNPRYFNVILKVQKWSQTHAYQQSENALNLSKHIASNQSQISADILSVYQERSRTMDSMNEKFDDYIRGLDTYTDTNGNKIRLPDWHAHLYSDGQGDYFYSDEPGVNKGYHELK